MSYEWFKSINKLNLENKSVLIIGAGFMGENYALALSKMKVRDVTILSRTPEKVESLAKKFNYRSLSGGFEKNLASLTPKDLVIIATPADLLISATIAALDVGQSTILIEKPGSLRAGEILALKSKVRKQNLRVAYNRVFYPHFHKMLDLVQKEGGITSCSYTFTEWIHKINPSKFPREELLHWGIANSLHVISTAHEIIGFPKEIAAYHGAGNIEWHPAGSVFVGCGISMKNIPFSYHANWESAGRWGIDVMTKEGAYRLMPMEELQFCRRGTVNWEKISCEYSFPDVKMGIAEEVAAMLVSEKDSPYEPMTLDTAAAYIKLANKIFGYKSP